jgi:Holliday junction resolvase RusA-like endonuclease
MQKLNIKPLSVNECWYGKHIATKKLRDYQRHLSIMLDNEIEFEELLKSDKKLQVNYTFGLSSKNADVDNVVKAFQDAIQEKYDFNDKRFYRIVAEKVDVKKGNEFIEFEIKEYL